MSNIQPLPEAIDVLVVGAGNAAMCAALAACDKQESENPDGSSNLCVKYRTCNECIAGQTAVTDDKGLAQTECALAAAGCWTTWEKPIKCGDEEVTEGADDEPREPDEAGEGE